MNNFWEKLEKPIFCLAPMADVTDCAFRQVIARHGKPDIFWTEFVSADGLCSKGRDKLLIDLIYSENERPVVAQIFGAKIENIREASKLCKNLGFDGIDINMGCPDKSIEKQCSGAALIKDPNLAKQIIRAAKEGGGGLPISVKTRIGYNKNEIETWLGALLSEDLAALTIHLRTRKEMSNVPARWELMRRIVEMRDEMKKETLILGNGDVLDLREAQEKIDQYNCDGVMLGRAIFGNPWLFSSRLEHPPKGTNNFLQKIFSARSSRAAQGLSKDAPSLEEKLKVMVEHTKLFEKMLGAHKNFAIMKKHYKAYVNGWEGAKELRAKLMETQNSTEVENIVNDFLG